MKQPKSYKGSVHYNDDKKRPIFKSDIRNKLFLMIVQKTFNLCFLVSMAFFNYTQECSNVEHNLPLKNNTQNKKNQNNLKRTEKWVK